MAKKSKAFAAFFAEEFRELPTVRERYLHALVRAAYAAGIRDASIKCCQDAGAGRWGLRQLGLRYQSYRARAVNSLALWDNLAENAQTCQDIRLTGGKLDLQA